jgi:hypothetical protein
MSKIAQFEHMRQLSLFYCNISNRGMLFLSLASNDIILSIVTSCLWLTTIFIVRFEVSSEHEEIGGSQFRQ